MENNENLNVEIIPDWSGCAYHVVVNDVEIGHVWLQNTIYHHDIVTKEYVATTATDHDHPVIVDKFSNTFACALAIITHYCEMIGVSS